jgi:HEAT repeat protein
MREMVAVSLLQQQSAAERLRGVTWSHQIEQPGEQVIDALLDTLRHDGNVNVRLAAVDALRQFGRADQVRAGLVDAVAEQSSPLVQIELINTLVEMRERRSRDALRRLAGDEQVDDTVRQRARWGLEQIG